MKFFTETLVLIVNFNIHRSLVRVERQDNSLFELLWRKERLCSLSFNDTWTCVIGTFSKTT